MNDLRLATWNLLHGIPVSNAGTVPPGARPDVSRAGELTSNLATTPEPSDQRWRTWIQDAMTDAAGTLACDVVAVQEVDRNSPRSGLVCHTSLLAETMSASSAFCPTLRGVPGEEWEPATGLDDPHPGAMYGIGLVSRHPVRRWHCHELPRSNRRLPLPIPGSPRPRFMWVSDEPRWALAAEIESPHGDVTVITTHLSFIPGVNLRQLRALTRWAQGLPGPVFLLGDLNLPHRILRTQSQWRLLAAHPTYPVTAPRVQFDHVAVLRPDTVAAHSTATHALAMGDHRALSAAVTVR